jgi:IstB-like ATP binding protein
MERTEVLDMMSGLKLYGMRGAYDETLATAIKRKHEPQRFVGDLLKAGISEKQARSIKYQLTVAKLPLAKDVDDFTFKNTPRLSCAIRPAADASSSSATSSSSAEPAPGRHIWPSPSREAASELDRAAASSPPSISSISSRPRAVQAAKDGSPIISHASTL